MTSISGSVDLTASVQAMTSWIKGMPNPWQNPNPEEPLAFFSFAFGKRSATTK